MNLKIILSIGVVFILAGCHTQNKPSTETVKQYSAQQLYHNENMYGIAFNADETKVLVNSDKTGIQNLYVLTIADTSIQPLTHSVKESLYGINYLPGSNSYLYASDQGGNENDHVFIFIGGEPSFALLQNAGHASEQIHQRLHRRRLGLDPAAARRNALVDGGCRDRRRGQVRDRGDRRHSRHPARFGPARPQPRHEQRDGSPVDGSPA